MTAGRGVGKHLFDKGLRVVQDQCFPGHQRCLASVQGGKYLCRQGLFDRAQSVAAFGVGFAGIVIQAVGMAEKQCRHVGRTCIF